MIQTQIWILGKSKSESVETKSIRVIEEILLKKKTHNVWSGNWTLSPLEFIHSLQVTSGASAAERGIDRHRRRYRRRYRRRGHVDETIRRGSVTITGMITVTNEAQADHRFPLSFPTCVKAKAYGHISARQDILSGHSETNLYLWSMFTQSNFYHYSLAICDIAPWRAVRVLGSTSTKCTIFSLDCDEIYIFLKTTVW